MSKHTPGPWTRIHGQRFKHDSSAGIKGPDGMYVAAALDRNDTTRDGEVEATATLIAAAPELLKACVAVASVLNDSGVLEAHNWRDIADNLQAAIAKAEATA